MTLPRSRLAQALILLVTCGVMAAFPLVNHFRHAGDNARTEWFAITLAGGKADPDTLPTGRNKDYPLWYATGRAFMAGEDVYPSADGVVYPFMYPPFAALLLGWLSLLGPDGMLLALVMLNVACVAVAVELSVRMAAGTGDVSLWLRVIPAAVCVFFVNDMFLLGQPNLGLLCLVLGGLMLVRSGREVAGGGLLAAATAIKAFPAVLIVYLVWRRQWRAAAAMAVFTAVFLLPLPGLVRGFDRSAKELKRWADGMLFKQGEGGFGQRPEQSLGWRNQSLFGVGHRLLRPVNTYIEDFPKTAEQVAQEQGWSVRQAEEALRNSPQRELFVNVLNLDHRQAQLGIVLIAGLLGLGFVSVMPDRAARTRDTDALEFGILVMLVTVCTPYAYPYYFVWLIYPLTACVWRGMNAGSATDRRIGWGTVIASAVCFAAGAQVGGEQSQLPMGLGAFFWAAISAAVGCGWLLRRERRRASP